MGRNEPPDRPRRYALPSPSANSKRCFPQYWVPPGATLEEANRVNRAIVEGSQRDGRVFLSSTMLDGRFTLRAVILVFRTHLRTVDLAVRVLKEQVAGCL